MNQPPVLKVTDLHTYFYARGKRAFIRSVDGVSLQIAKGQTLGIVGESGSGKSVTALSIMGLVETDPGVIAGSIRLQANGASTNLLDGLDQYSKTLRQDGRIMQVTKDVKGWRRRSDHILKGIRGSQIAMIFQDARSALNPFSTIGRQISEAVLLNTAIKDPREARQRAMHWLAQVRIDAPALRYHNNPYGLSGGMCQRAMIAMALATEPALLIADEPTTGLDATIQSRIVDLLADLKASLGVTTLLISHDIDVIRQLADEVAVMYGGTVMEQGPVAEVLAPAVEAKHPYTAALLASIPDKRLIQAKGQLRAIDGEVLDTINVPEGCRFYPRCRMAHAAIEKHCREREPELRPAAGPHEIRCWLYQSIQDHDPNHS